MNSNIPKRVFYALLGCILFLLILNVWSYLHLYYNDLKPDTFFFRKTNFNEEKNVPSIFSSILHFSACILLAVVAWSEVKIKKRKRFWLFLSFLLLFTGLDELLRIHEMAGRAISTRYETSGIFLFSWVIPYGIAVIILSFFLFKPLLEVPKRTLKLFITAGLIFLFGAIGIEMFTGWYIGYKEFDHSQLLIIPDIFILSTIEELLEMIGMSIFIYSILDFLIKFKYQKK